jgi:peptide/nickel transport system substrate-binding protein
MFSANDVKFTLDRASQSPHISHIAGEIQSTEVINDYEVLITLNQPFVPIINNLAHTAMSIVNERAVVEGGDAYAQNPVGTGPMRFVNWVVGDQINLTRNDDYWGAAPRIRNITVRYIADMMTQMLELETGGVDMILTIPPQDIPRIAGNPDLQISRRPGLQLNYFGFNLQRPPFNDVRVRQAIAHAVDMPALVSNVWPGIGQPGRAPISSVVWASAAGVLPQHEFNPERSRQLLAEAGYPDGFTATIVMNQNPERIAAAEIMQSMLAQVGITMDINIMEWAAYLDMVDIGDHDIFILGWVTVTGDPDYGLFPTYHSDSWGEGGNRSRYSNPEADRLIELGRTETDSARRLEYYAEAQRIIAYEVPTMWLNQGAVRFATLSKWSGFEMHPAGHHTFHLMYQP